MCPLDVVVADCSRRAGKDKRLAAMFSRTVDYELHVDDEHQTSSPAVAEKPRDASCLSVASTVQYAERKFRFRFTAACNSNLFPSLLFVVVVHDGCDKQDHWCVAVCAVNCTVAVAVTIRTAAVIDPIARYWPRIAMFAYLTCIRRSR